MKLLFALFGIGLIKTFAQNNNNNNDNKPTPAKEHYVSCLRDDVGVTKVKLLGGWFPENTLPDGVFNKASIVKAGLMTKEDSDKYSVKKVWKQAVQKTTRYSITLNGASGDAKPICALVSKTDLDDAIVRGVHFSRKKMFKPKKKPEDVDEEDEVTMGFQKRYNCHETDINHASQMEKLVGGWKQDIPKKDIKQSIVSAATDADTKKKADLDEIQKMLLKPENFFVKDCWTQLVSQSNNYICQVQVTGLMGAPDVCIRFNKTFTDVVTFSKVHNTIFPNQSTADNDVNFGNHGDKHDKKQKERKNHPRKFKACYRDVNPDGKPKIGGWSPADFDQFKLNNKDTSEVLKDKKCKEALKKRFGRFFFKLGVTFHIADVWKQTVNGVNYLVEIHMKNIKSPLCLRFHKPLSGAAQFVSAKLAARDHKIKADDFLEDFFRGMPKLFRPKRSKPKKDHGDKTKVRCADQLIKKVRAGDKVRDGYRKADDSDADCNAKVMAFMKKNKAAVKAKVDDFDDSSEEDIPKKYSIRECWKRKNADGEDVVSSVEPNDEKKKKFCLKFKKADGKDGVMEKAEPRKDKVPAASPSVL